MGFSLGGPVVKDKVHFFASGEYIRVRSDRHPDHAGCRRPSSSRPARRRRRPSSTPTAAARRSTARSSPAARSPRSSARRPARSTACRPSLPVFGQVSKSAADRRGRRRPAGQLPVRRPPRLQPELDHPGLRPLRLPEPGDGAGHERLEPLRRIRHGLRQQQPQPPRVVDARLLADLHQPDARWCGTACRATSRSTATRSRRST